MYVYSLAKIEEDYLQKRSREKNTGGKEATERALGVSISRAQTMQGW